MFPGGEPFRRRHKEVCLQPLWPGAEGAPVKALLA